LGETPARFVESLRLDAARVLLSQKLSIKTIAGGRDDFRTWFVENAA
jgi:transcriptional regulator GlxA family with amidase domain